VDASGKTNPRVIAQAVTNRLGAFKDVATPSAPALNKTGDVAIVSVTPKSGPSARATKKLVSAIRTAATPVQKKYGIAVLVTGTTALNIDVSNKLSAGLPVMLVLIVVLALVLLMVVFRSLLVPVKAVAGSFLTIGLALGLEDAPGWPRVTSEAQTRMRDVTQELKGDEFRGERA
jgi:RND superfamily putative drug exporter